MKNLTLLVIFVLFAGCSSPEENNGSVSRTNNGVADSGASDSTGDAGASGSMDMPTGGGEDATSAPDVGTDPVDMSTPPPPDMTTTPDQGGSMLPTECRNDCLCTSSCDHRCNIQCKTECASGTCNFELNAGAEITCRAGSTCNISCESGACEVTCEPGATCNLRCGPQTVACFFKECGGQEQECSSREKTCGGSC